MEHLKRDKGGEEVPLTDRYKQMISYLRDGAGRIIEALHDVLRMLGQTDPDETAPSHLPGIQGISNDDRTLWRRMATSLIDVMTRVRDRDWNTSTWEDDVQLLNQSFGTDCDMHLWGMDLWEGLHELNIDFGLASGAYRPVYTWKIFFARNEPTWPAQGADPREHIEVSRTIANYLHGLTDLRNEIRSIERSRAPVSTTVLEWVKSIAFGRGGGRVGGKPTGKK